MYKLHKTILKHDFISLILTYAFIFLIIVLFEIIYTLPENDSLQMWIAIAVVFIFGIVLEKMDLIGRLLQKQGYQYADIQQARAEIEDLRGKRFCLEIFIGLLLVLLIFYLQTKLYDYFPNRITYLISESWLRVLFYPLFTSILYSLLMPYIRIKKLERKAQTT